MKRKQVAAIFLCLSVLCSAMPTLSASAKLKNAVYLTNLDGASASADQKDGNDEKDGLSVQSAVKSFSRAFDVLGDTPGRVVVVNNGVLDLQGAEKLVDDYQIEGRNDDSTLLYGTKENTLTANMNFSHINLSRSDANKPLITDGSSLSFAEDVNFINGAPCVIYRAGVDNKAAFETHGGKIDSLTVESDASRTMNKTVLDGTTVSKLTVGTKSDKTDVKVLADGSSIAEVVPADGAAYASAQIIANNGGEIGKKELYVNTTWFIESEKDAGAYVDFGEKPGTFAVTTPYGKNAVAISEDGKVYFAADGTTSVDQPVSHDELQEFSSFINYRRPLTNTYKKLTTGDKTLNVLYFGGSVTAGYGSSNGKYCWQSLVGSWLKDTFPDATINNINRAVGESGTYLGTFRVQRDVIAHKPDLVFVEYSINDKYYNSSYANAAIQYETIVREIRETLPYCDIVTILVTDNSVAQDAKDGKLHTQAQAHEDMAALYNIPTIHVGRALASRLPDGWTFEKDWKDVYMIDIVHPNDAGYKVYYDCIHEFMHNSLLCTDYSGCEMIREELIPVQNKNLFDGNRTIHLCTEELLKKSEALGGCDFTYNGGLYGVHDYKGYFTVPKDKASTAVLAFEFDGTEMAIMTNFYSESAIMVSVDGAKYKKKACLGHSPSKVAEKLDPGHHVIRIQPVFNASSPGTMNIGAIFTRDSSKQTTKGTTYTYTDCKKQVLTLPAGRYQVKYTAATTLCELPVVEREGYVFTGYVGADGKMLDGNTPITANTVCTASYLDLASYINANGTQNLTYSTSLQPAVSLEKMKGETASGISASVDQMRQDLTGMNSVKGYLDSRFAGLLVPVVTVRYTDGYGVVRMTKIH